ncbi:peptidase inhibitor family I36 protein [Streptomyces sp. NBC_00151]|nr:peptidase inhibitor family I36 protein [Streptomyces sp. NBC_00151]
MASSTAAQAASTDGVCPSGDLCLWEYANYTGGRLISASTNACVEVTSGPYGYKSYISHLPVTAVLWYGGQALRTLPAGGFSSNFGQYYLADYICTNGRSPY